MNSLTLVGGTLLPVLNSLQSKFEVLLRNKLSYRTKVIHNCKQRELKLLSFLPGSYTGTAAIRFS
jgi:hypothetical protein